MPSPLESRWRRWIAAFALYLAAARLGLSVPFTSVNVSPFWPAAGVALALLTRWGLDLWPAIAAAAFAANATGPMPIGTAAALGLGNALGAVCGAYALRRTGLVDRALSSLRDVLALVGLGALLSTTAAATCGAGALFLSGLRPWPEFGTAWRVWWLGDGMGVLIVAPLLLLSGSAARSPRGRRLLELVALLVSVGAAAYAVFGRQAGVSVPPLILFPLAVCAAIRFGIPGAAVVNAITAVAAIYGTAAGFGPFIRRTPLGNLVLMQFFFAVMSVTSLIVAAIMTERRDAESAMRDLSGRLLKLQDEERRRLVRELHDSTGQSLTALMMNLAAVRNHDAAMDGQARQALRRSLELAEEVVKEIRTLCCLLHPPLLDDVGLASALRWYAESLEKRGDLRIDVGVPEDWRRLPREVETALFRIAQEALTNIVRHSGSRTAAISLEEQGGLVRLRVVDRGRGLSERSYGVGIIGMRERVRELGGRLVIEPANPGTAVEVTLPIEKR